MDVWTVSGVRGAGGFVTHTRTHTSIFVLSITLDWCCTVTEVSAVRVMFMFHICLGINLKKKKKKAVQLMVTMIRRSPTLNRLQINHQLQKWKLQLQRSSHTTHWLHISTEVNAAKRCIPETIWRRKIKFTDYCVPGLCLHIRAADVRKSVSKKNQLLYVEIHVTVVHISPLNIQCTHSESQIK